MDWSNKRILESFYGIVADSKNMNSGQLEQKYADFKETHSKLYQLTIDSIVSGKVQETFAILTEMLKNKQLIENGASKRDIDIKVGNSLAEKYIYTVIEKPSDNELAEAAALVNSKYTKDGNEVIDTNE